MAAVPPKSYGISDFKSRALNIAQTSLYQLTIPGVTEDLTLLCYEASLPGSSLMTHDVTNDYHGVSEKMAYRRNFGQEVSLGFYVDRNYNIIEVFENWMDSIIPIDESGSTSHFRVSYRKSYAKRISIVKFEKDHFKMQKAPLKSESSGSKSILHYEFIDAFPTAINSMSVSYDQSDVLKCNVTFSYSRYIVSKSLSSPTTSGTGEPKQSTAPGVPRTIRESQKGPFDLEYELAPVPGQFTVPPGQGGASDLFGKIGGIGVKNPVVR